MKSKPPLEKVVQTQVKRLYQKVGCSYWDTSQPFRAKITPGLPDLFVCHPGTEHSWFHEVKREGAKLTPAQVVFKTMAENCGQDVVVGGTVEAAAHLQALGILEAA